MIMKTNDYETPNTPTSIRFPDELLKKIDIMRAKYMMSRSSWVVKVLVDAVEEMERQEQLKKQAT